MLKWHDDPRFIIKTTPPNIAMHTPQRKKLLPNLVMVFGSTIIVINNGCGGKRQTFFRGANGLQMYLLTSFLEHLNEGTRCRKMGPLNVLTITKNGAIVAHVMAMQN